MKRHAPCSLLALLLLATPLSASLSACGASLATLQDTLALWHHGERQAAVTRTADEYTRFRSANDLQEARVRTWADALATRVDEEPIVPRGEVASPLPGQRVDHGPGALDRELRADLLSARASRIARAIGVVRGLALPQHATGLITLIYDRRAVEADGAVLKGLDDAQRSVTLKRMALDALEGLQ